MVISLLQTCINSDYHLPASQTPQSPNISTQTFADYTIQSKLWLAKDVLTYVNIVEYSRRNETGNTASTRMVSKQYLLSLAILSIFSKVRTKSVTSMSINPRIGFTVCSCFLIWVCLYRVCFILQEQSTFKVFWLIGPKNLMQTHNVKVHPGSIPNVSTVHTTFSIETCIWRTLVHSRRGCPLNTGFTASLRAVTGLNVWCSLPHNERL